jgi:ABC-type sugar transport system permease subunit
MGSFNLFSEIYNLTQGGPVNATITPVILIFRQAFTNFRLGYASAMAYLYFLVLFALTLIQFRYFGQQAD